MIKKYVQLKNMTFNFFERISSSRSYVTLIQWQVDMRMVPETNHRESWIDVVFMPPTLINNLYSREMLINVSSKNLSQSSMNKG